MAKLVPQEKCDSRSVSDRIHRIEMMTFARKVEASLKALHEKVEKVEKADIEKAAPASARYTSHSGGIIDILEDMKEKTEGELSDLRKVEGNAKQEYAMLKDLEDEKSGEAAAEKEKAAAEDEKSGEAAAEEEKAASSDDSSDEEPPVKALANAFATGANRTTLGRRKLKLQVRFGTVEIIEISPFWLGCVSGIDNLKAHLWTNKAEEERNRDWWLACLSAPWRSSTCVLAKSKA